MIPHQRAASDAETPPSKEECWEAFWSVVVPELARLHGEGKLHGYDLGATRPLPTDQ